MAEPRGPGVCERFGQLHFFNIASQSDVAQRKDRLFVRWLSVLTTEHVYHVLESHKHSSEYLYRGMGDINIHTY